MQSDGSDQNKQGVLWLHSYLSGLQTEEQHDVSISAGMRSFPYDKRTIVSSQSSVQVLKELLGLIRWTLAMPVGKNVKMFIFKAELLLTSPVVFTQQTSNQL